MLTNEQIILLQNLRMLVVPQPLQGQVLLKLLQSAYEDVPSEWADTFMVCKINPQTNLVVVVYHPFPDFLPRM